MFLTYDDDGRVTEVSDDIGGTFHYAYDSSGRLIEVEDPAGESELYAYNPADDMTTVADKRGQVKVTNTDNFARRISGQTYAASSTSSFSYAFYGAGRVIRTDFTDQRGAIKRTAFSAQGKPTEIKENYGLSSEKTFGYIRDSSNSVLTYTDDWAE